MQRSASHSSGTVYVVDDDAGLQRSLEFLLSSAGLKTHVFSSAEDFLAKLPPPGRSCLVLDLRMPNMNGEELMRELKQRDPTLPVIVLTGHGDVPAAVRLMKLGAHDFLQKPVNHALLLDAIRDAIESAGQARASPAAGGTGETQLTSREKEVLDRLCAGKPTKRIAFELSLSVKTVEHYRSRLLQKFEAANVAELIYRAVGPGRTMH